MKLLKDNLKYTPRKEQTDTLDFIKPHLAEGSSTKFFMLDLPVGVGKSYLTMMIADYYIDNINKNANFDVLTNSKILQKQYTDDFNVFANLWGKQNYKCVNFDTSCKEGAELNKLNKGKTPCLGCPYTAARDGFINSKINLTNFHLFILLNMFQTDLTESRGSNVLIIDEAHDFEVIFSDFLTITLSEKILKKLGFKNWKAIGKSIKGINDIYAFNDFVERLDEEIVDTIQSLTIDSKTNNKKEKLTTLNKLSDVQEMKNKLDSFVEDFDIRPENWIVEWELDSDKIKKISVKPVWSHPYLETYIWSKYDHVFLMSGTFLSKKLTAYLNGIPDSVSTYYKIDSPFPSKNRPIYYMPIAKMNFKNKQNAFIEYKPILNKLLSKYKNKKGILHTHTYEIANWVSSNINNDNNRLIFHASDGKDAALDRHVALQDQPTVLVSPSMATGVNLDYDKARFQILLKVPYPSLGSLKNKTRHRMMPEWYVWKTISGIIQAYGRAIRSYDDYADFVIVDQCFSDILKYSSAWIPDYITECITRVDIKKK